MTIATESVSVELPKSAKDLADGVEKFIGVAAQALKDGFQAGQDVPVILLSALNDLLPAVKAASEVAADLHEMPAETAYCFGKAGLNIVKAIKAPVAPAAG